MVEGSDVEGHKEVNGSDPGSTSLASLVDRQAAGIRSFRETGGIFEAAGELHLRSPLVPTCLALEGTDFSGEAAARS